MSATKDGGPAFPSSPTVGPMGDVYRPADIGCGGMTLRDYFAAKAMQAYLSQAGVVTALGREAITHGDVATASYSVSDAMLEARKVTP